MPPRKKKSVRCSLEGCTRRGYGDPPICDEHYEEMEEEEDVVQHTVDVVVNHPRVQGLFAYFASGVDRIAETVDRVARGEGFRRPQPQAVPDDAEEPQPQRREAPRRPQPPPPRSAPRQEDPRVVFGFPATLPLTREIIKKRHRELARILHSDTGGNDESMKRLNAARDLLFTQVKT